MKKIISMLGLCILSLAFREAPAREVNSLLLRDLAIPKSLGKIEERHIGTQSRWIIHIQDVHAHLVAQENIAAILDHLNALYGIKTVALEGGWSATSLPKSWALPTSREKQMLARALLEDDYITGPVYAALFSPTPIMLVGIEDKILYETNRQIYVKHLSQRHQTQTQVEAYEKKIKAEKMTVYGPDLKSFDDALLNFREGEKAETFLPSLIPWTASKGIAIEDLDQLQIFKQVMEASRDIQKELLESEAKRLELAYKREGLHFEELVRSGKIPDEKLEFYPETQKFIKLLKIQDKLSHRRFFAQIEEASKRLKDKLFQSEEEKLLDQKSERFGIAKKIILFQATPEDLKKFQAFHLDVRADIADAGLTDALELGLQFYDVAVERDKIFFEKIISHPDLAGNIAVVTGGFHTEGLSDQLDSAGFSYIVLSPDLANESPDEKLYFERLSEILPQSQTLSDLRNKANKRFDRAFARAASELRTTRDIRRAMEVVKTYEIGPPTQRQKPPEEFRPFTSLQRQEQSKAIRTAAESVSTANAPVWLFTRAATLNRLFQESPLLAKTLWNLAVSNEANKIVLLYEDIGEILNIEGIENPNVQRMRESDFDRVLGQRKFEGARAKKLIAVMAADYAKPNYVLLDEHVISLLLFRPLVEGGWRYSYRGTESQTLIQELIADAIERGAIKRAA
ncbi:MAG: hypothetical protein NC930_07970 [Candidatus Omnitrophica bacterium]|nr:hypothetical protein [Candidatus Omnitrophota bacterium]